jgi:outer membrane receptor protein involved in Fe transport
VDYAWSDELKVLGGFQANQIEGLDLDVVPRLGVIWDPTAQVNVKLLFSEAYRAPSINESSLQHPALLGNPDLEPERVATLDLGVTYRGERGQIGLNVFRSELDHLVTQDRTGPIPVYANSESTVEIRGVELEGKFFLDEAWFLTGSLLRQHSADGAGSRAVTPIASFGAKAGISYAGPQGLTVGLFDVYQGGLADHYDTTLNPSPRPYHKVSLHVRVDLERTLGWKLGRASAFFVQIDNLLDREIWLPAWGLNPGQSLPFDAGRAAHAGLQVAF